MVEQRPFKALVESSNLSEPTIKKPRMKSMEPGCYKYVRLNDNTMVFGPVITSTHANLIPVEKTPKSAGFLIR